MRTAAVALCALLAAVAVRAQEQPPAARTTPQRSGYAFDQPRILAQQRIFGLAHGIGLLAAFCRNVPSIAETTQAAYAAWRARQGPTIAGAVADLSAYYFGAGIADWQALAHQMGLKDALPYPPDSPELQAACATFPAALEQPRYDLVTRLRLEEQMARVTAATRIEAQEAYCRDIFDGEARKVYTARYDLWREINAPVLDEALATLAREWPADAPTASFAAWRDELRREVRAGGGIAACERHAAFLKQPEAALRNVFYMPPPRGSDSR